MDLNVIRLQHGTKIPIKGCNWREEDTSIPFNTVDTSKYGVGLVLGKCSSIVALDLDDDVDGLHKKVLDIAGRSPIIKVGEKGSTHFYRYSGEKKHQYTKDGICVLDLLGEGSYTVLPPSKHPNTNLPYTYTDRSFNETDINELPFLPTDFKEQLDKLFGKGKPEVKITEYYGAVSPNTYPDTSKTDIEEALTYISPNGYEDWISVGMALYNSDIEDSFELWMNWNEGYLENNPNSKRPGTEEYRWNSFFTPSKDGITVATIFKMAMDNGYKKHIKDVNVLYKGKADREADEGEASLVNPLYNISKAVDVIEDWEKNGYPVGESIGMPGFQGEQSNLNFRMRKGEMTTVTGYYGDGKTEVVNFMTYLAAENIGYRTLSFSFEEKTTAHLVESHMTRYVGKRMKLKNEAFNKDIHRSNEESKEAIEFITKHFLFYDNIEMSNKIEDMMEVCEELKDEIDIVVIDNFSNIRSEYGASAGDMNHVEGTVRFISRMAKKLDAHIFFIAHPTKKNRYEQPMTLNMKEVQIPYKPDLSMVSGGAIWGNTSDNGIVVKRDGFDSIITVCKIKDQNYGDQEGQIILKYNKPARRFELANNEF